ncbi:MAG: Flp pilus assembly complex ATPase component TadA [Phycisphaerales bacterium]|nr:Flp pilus assembly complex ATPase component TadA [Phycisphaerales bacterium]
MNGPYLEIQHSGSLDRLALNDSPITVGRHESNTLVLTDLKASRFHAVIKRVEEVWQVHDLQSSNGTYVNSQRIQQQTLTPGDVIRIGKTRIVLLDPSTDAPPALDTLEQLSQSATAHPAFTRPAVASALGALSVDDDPYLEDSLDTLPTAEDTDTPVPIAFDEAPVEPADSSLGAGIPSFEQNSPSWDNVQTDPQQALQELADSMGQKPFGEYDIALLNSRGGVVHEATSPRRGENRRDAVDLFRLLLIVCFRSRATDLHLEPKDGYWQLRMRVDGHMVDIVRLNSEMGTRISAMVKICSDIDISQRNVIQEGHFSARVPSMRPGGALRRVDYRVSFAPSVFGQKLVIRILDTADAPLRLENLSLPDWMLAELRSTIEADSGTILVVGPTGSGKTTSLYAIVRSMNLNDCNVVTIEDPVEIQLEGVTQIPVDEQNDKSFSRLLRSVLRQDPDAILVGEIRDPETARIAMQAAITGHLVFSTLHTRDTIGTMFRLLDLGVEPYLLAQAVNVVLAQRLVRKLCTHCRRAVTPTPEQLQRLGKWGQNLQQIYEPVGCPRCLGTGHIGRRAIFELLRSTPELRSHLLRNPSADEIRQTLADTQFLHLQEHGYQLVAEGICSFSEIERAAGK